MRSRVARAVDMLVAVGVAALVLAETLADPLVPYGASVPLGLLQAAALAFRRRAALAVVAVTSASELGTAAAGVSLHTPVYPIVVGLVAVFSVALYESFRRAALGLGVALVGIFGAIQLASTNGESYGVGDRLFVLVFLVAPWLVGRALHGRTREATELGERAARLEREHEAAVAGERARIARELHDVIAHSLSVIVVQAGAGERVVEADPSRGAETFRSIQQVGRQALVEMSRLVGVLRDGGEEVGLEPQPGLDQLDSLVEQTRRAGVPVELSVEGGTRVLPAGLDLSAYRIVQEALTNARKHAHGARVRVTVRYTDATLALEIVNDGTHANGARGGGHGLIGMRERAAVFGGTFEAGARPDGGFAVRITLPLDTVPA